MKEMKYLDRDEVAGVEKFSQKKSYTILLTIKNVAESGDAEVELEIYDSKVINTKVEIDGKQTVNRTNGKEGKLCKAVVNKNGKLINLLPTVGQEGKTKAVGDTRKKVLLERIIVPLVGGRSSTGKEEFNRHPLEGMVLEYKGKDRDYKDAKGKAGIIFEAEGSSFCRTRADEEIKKNEELEVREKKTVCFDGSAGILARQNYSWVFEDRYHNSYARVKEVMRISVQVNIAK